MFLEILYKFQPSPRPVHVSTPEPTPKASPRSSPPHHRAPAPTPPASPAQLSPRVRPEPEAEEPVVMQPLVPVPVQPVVEPESEPESSASYDIQEELHRLAGKTLKKGINRFLSKVMHEACTVFLDTFVMQY